MGPFDWFGDSGEGFTCIRLGIGSVKSMVFLFLYDILIKNRAIKSLNRGEKV